MKTLTLGGASKLTDKSEDRVGDLCDFYGKIELAQQIVKLEIQVEGYKKLHEHSLKMLNLLGEE